MSPLPSTGLPVVHIQIRGTCCALLPSLQPAVLFIYRFSRLTPPDNCEAINRATIRDIHSSMGTEWPTITGGQMKEFWE